MDEGMQYISGIIYNSAVCLESGRCHRQAVHGLNLYRIDIQYSIQ